MGQSLLTSTLLFYKNQSFLVDETPREGIYDSGVASGRSIFRCMRVQRMSLPAFAVFQVLAAQNNHYTKVAYLGWHILLPFMRNTSCFVLFSLCLLLGKCESSTGPIHRPVRKNGETVSIGGAVENCYWL